MTVVYCQVVRGMLTDASGWIKPLHCCRHIVTMKGTEMLLYVMCFHQVCKYIMERLCLSHRSACFALELVSLTCCMCCSMG